MHKQFTKQDHGVNECVSVTEPFVNGCRPQLPARVRACVPVGAGAALGLPQQWAAAVAGLWLPARAGSSPLASPGVLGVCWHRLGARLESRPGQGRGTVLRQAPRSSLPPAWALSAKKSPQTRRADIYREVGHLYTKRSCTLTGFACCKDL